MTRQHWSRGLVCSHPEDRPSMVDQWGFSIHTPVNDYGPHTLRPSSVYLSLDVLPSSVHSAVTPYKRLGKISDILHLNNENNQLERWARPPKDVLLDAQSWTWASCLSSRVAAVTTVTYASWGLSREFHNRFITELSSRVLSRAERTLEECFL